MRFHQRIQQQHVNLKSVQDEIEKFPDKVSNANRLEEPFEGRCLVVAAPAATGPGDRAKNRVAGPGIERRGYSGTRTVVCATALSDFRHYFQWTESDGRRRGGRRVASGEGWMGGGREGRSRRNLDDDGCGADDYSL